MRSVFATPGSRLAARVALYAGALFVGLPFAASQLLVGTFRAPTLRPWAPWTQIAVVSGELRLRAWLAPGEAQL